MKIIRFASASSRGPEFGVVIHDHAVSFSALQHAAGRRHPELADSRRYLSGLPGSEQAARELTAWGEQHLDELETAARHPLGAVRLLEPVDVAALFDFGLTPRHLKNSAETMLMYEKDDPHTAPLLQAFAKVVMAEPAARPPGQPEHLSYYKGNMNAVVGDGEVVPWPAYTSRLDIEPELAFVYGNDEQPVAGVCIFNDVSARDVQAPEFIGGFCLTKDMAKGNQLGPYLVTLDEAGDPYGLAVTVTVDGEPRFHGATSEIDHKAEDVFAFLETMAPLKPGTVIGCGTIPDCTGLDHDDFLDPGAEIEISFQRLATLRCRLAEPTDQRQPSRWPVRPSLLAYTDTPAGGA
jgi:2-keto-4-pentenoate hydratase/2-oxohepta-3-ene-1,7-dioic acid hydratase in catechol pathway